MAIGVCAGLAFPACVKSTPLIVWNATASVPVGLYWVSRPGALKRGDLVLVWLPAAARRLAAERGYLPAETPAIKRVVAVAADRICAAGHAIYVNGEHRTEALTHDRFGRPLVAWRGCDVLSDGQFFLLNDAPASFDGRYFGPSLRTDVVGILSPLWTF
ncbi:MAG: S26 family signal peptidase [Methyloceanibacter sp.]